MDTMNDKVEQQHQAIQNNTAEIAKMQLDIDKSANQIKTLEE